MTSFDPGDVESPDLVQDSEGAQSTFPVVSEPNYLSSSWPSRPCRILKELDWPKDQDAQIKVTILIERRMDETLLATLTVSPAESESFARPGHDGRDRVKEPPRLTGLPDHWGLLHALPSLLQDPPLPARSRFRTRPPPATPFRLSSLRTKALRPRTQPPTG